MSLNSVNTNSGAMVALQSLNRTNEQMAVTQKRISTGLKVADAKDDGASFAVAQKVRADIAGLSAANDQLGAARGMINTTLQALGKVSSKMAEIKETLVTLASQGTDDTKRAQLTEKFLNQVKEVNAALGDASYNGQSLLASQDSQGTATVTVANPDQVIVRNEKGSEFKLAATDAASLTFDSRVATRGKDNSGTWVRPDEITLATASISATQAKALLGSEDVDNVPDIAAYADNAQFGGGAAAADMKTFKTVETAINNALTKYGDASKYVDNQISYNKNKLDAMEGGLGALVDADLAKESAKLQSLQIRQQLGTQSLSIANQAPQSLLSLFR
jgi:flagellin